MNDKTLENLIIKVGKLEDKVKALEGRYNAVLLFAFAAITYELLKVIF